MTDINDQNPLVRLKLDDPLVAHTVRLSRRVDDLIIVALAARHVLARPDQENLDILRDTLDKLPPECKAAIGYRQEVLDWQI